MFGNILFLFYLLMNFVRLNLKGERLWRHFLELEKNLAFFFTLEHVYTCYIISELTPRPPPWIFILNFFFLFLTALEFKSP